MKETMVLQKVNICEEEPVQLLLNGKDLVTFMCTPNELKELAMGHLLSRGIIKSVKDITSLGACKDMKMIFATSSIEVDFGGIELNTVLSSGCGSGVKFNESIAKLPKIESDFHISIEKVKKIAIEMFSEANMYRKYGGMHCAALSDGREILALSEDVGRHNAVDKVLGKGILKEVNFRSTMLMTTGRISTDMILKAANVACPFVVSRSIPTTSALELANNLGITVIGRINSSNPIVYMYEERIAI
ncbi:formate dehydrogenase accessory sulfurtransferase FdhD [Sedimentibacter sp.]|uniref:formate dehydrogenase accessory sulfurtransferase FdhD n=1 Tax=Sedimentibacter sp. TaxID=1960295 RepID=UPI000EECB143|nr:formate dehydrogenase accessory sulfurtransferase FdhD [Sedimentibacter sp.]HCX61425.1 formate dehydrogenase accessory sulfurtransferase FdhD [Clostridiales bacterium]